MFQERSDFLYESIGVVLGASYGFLAYQDLPSKISENVSNTMITLGNFGGGMLSAVALESLSKFNYGTQPLPGGEVFVGSVALGVATYYLDKSYNLTDSIMPAIVQNTLDYFETDHTLFAMTSGVLTGSILLIYLEHQMSSYIILP